MNRSLAVHRGPTRLVRDDRLGNDVEVFDADDDVQSLGNPADESVTLACFCVRVLSSAQSEPDEVDEDDADDDPYYELGDGD